MLDFTEQDRDKMYSIYLKKDHDEINRQQETPNLEEDENDPLVENRI